MQDLSLETSLFKVTCDISRDKNGVLMEERVRRGESLTGPKIVPCQCLMLSPTS